MVAAPAPSEPSQQRSRGLWIALLVATLATAFSLGAALAHLLELPNKISLASEQYFVIQQIYAGWNRLAVVLALQFVSIIAVLFLSRRYPRVFWAASVALAGLIAAQIVFWIFTYPANVATGNWTTIPLDWESLRNRWEYSHAVGAVFQFVAMGALAVASLAYGRTLVIRA